MKRHMFVKHLGGKLRSQLFGVKIPFRIPEMLRGEGRENYRGGATDVSIMNEAGK